MADDIISQGGDGERSPWPRRLAVIAVLVLLAVAIVRLLPHHRPARMRRHGRLVAAGPVQLAGLGNAVAVDLDKAGSAGAPATRWPSSVRLLLTTGPAWFWPATGRVEPIDGLPGDPSGYMFSRVGGGWAVQASAPARGCRGCGGPGSPVYFLADGAMLASPIGVAEDVAPAARAGQMWLTRYRPGADPGTAAGTARLVSVTGPPPGPPVRLPAGYQIVQGTSRGLLLASVIERSPATAFLLWNPATGLISRSFDDVIAASRGEIAWRPECGTVCALYLLDLTTGRDTTVRLPASEIPVSGAFSPGGTFLALQVSVGSGRAGTQAGWLVVVAADSGRLLPTPRTLAGGASLTGFGWPVSGDRLVAELSSAAGTQVVSWRPGADQAAVAALRPNAPSG